MASHGPTPKKPRARRFRIGTLVAAVGITFAVALTAVAAQFVNLESKLGNVKHAPLTPHEVSAAYQQPADTSATATTTTILLLAGGDQASDQAVAGANMLLVIPADHKRLDVISISKTLELPDTDEQLKIFAKDSAPKAVASLEKALESPIDHAIVIDGEGYQAMLDALGTIEVDNPTASTRFPSERASLDSQAMLRYLHDPQLSEDQLADRQSAVIKRLFLTAFANDTLINQPKFTAFLDSMTKHMTVSEDLSREEMRKTFLDLRSVPKDAIHFFKVRDNGDLEEVSTAVKDGTLDKLKL